MRADQLDKWVKEKEARLTEAEERNAALQEKNLKQASKAQAASSEIRHDYEHQVTQLREAADEAIER